jgi:hypothetical protein
MKHQITKTGRSIPFAGEKHILLQVPLFYQSFGGPDSLRLPEPEIISAVSRWIVATAFP